jgi:hypothetical protein
MITLGNGWPNLIVNMSSHFLYEMKARLEHAVKIEEPLMFKAEVESILKDLQAEVDPFECDRGMSELDDQAVWEEPSKSQEAEGIKRKKV